MNVGEIWTVYFLISSLPFISKNPKRSHFSLPLLCHRHYPFSLCFFFFPPSYFFPILSPYPCHSPISTIPRLSIRWRHQSTLSFSFSLSLHFFPSLTLSPSHLHHAIPRRHCWLRQPQSAAHHSYDPTTATSSAIILIVHHWQPLVAAHISSTTPSLHAPPMVVITYLDNGFVERESPSRQWQRNDQHERWFSCYPNSLIYLQRFFHFWLSNI